MGLDQVAEAQSNDDEEAKIRASQAKGKGKEEEIKPGQAAHQDDAHYFESYQYNGEFSTFNLP